MEAGAVVRRPPVRRRAALAIAAVLLAAAALIDVQVIEPRVHVRWREDLTAQERAALEARYSLKAGEQVEGSTWRYQLHDRSRENVAALLGSAAVTDTGYIDRPTLAVPEREIDLTVSPRRIVGPSPWSLVQPQSVVLAIAGGLLLWSAGFGGRRPHRSSEGAEAGRRRAFAVAILGSVAAAALVFPLHQPLRMGDSETYVRNRAAFEDYSGVRAIRFEAHLSHAALGRLDRLHGATEESPRWAMRTLSRAATVWFVVCALAVVTIERWSPASLRYIGLAVLAPATLLYFGYLELGHLSLNVAVFPLLVRGLRQRDGHLEAAAALAGVGAALHGFGLLSVAGAVLAALVLPAAFAERGRLALRALAWSTAAYAGWIAIYVVVLKLPVTAGHADSIPLRPWLVDAVVGGRLNAAILSGEGLRDVLFSAVIVGVPMAAAAAGAWRRFELDARLALAYSIPSALFLLRFWPIQGLGVEMDLVVAAFPATFALAWVAAQEPRATIRAALVLGAAHLAFWRVLLDTAFVNSPN